MRRMQRSRTVTYLNRGSLSRQQVTRPGCVRGLKSPNAHERMLAPPRAPCAPPRACLCLCCTLCLGLCLCLCLYLCLFLRLCFCLCVGACWMRSSCVHRRRKPRGMLR